MKTLEEITAYKIPADFGDLISELSDCDGWMSKLIIYDRDTAVVLEAMGFASRNARGSYGGTKKLKDVYNKEDVKGVTKAVVAFCKEKNIKVFETKVRYDYEEL